MRFIQIPIPAFLVAFKDLLNQQSRFDLATGFSLPIVLLYGGRDDFAVVLTITLAIALPQLRKSPILWLALTIFLALENMNGWYFKDNHKYLVNYWCFAMFLSCLQNNKNEVVIEAGKLLIGLAFAFSMLWKLISPDFVSGTFFTYTLIDDSRFHALTIFLAGITQADLAYNGYVMSKLDRGEISENVVELILNNRVSLLALVLTYWTLFIEGAIAVLFLLPRKLRLAKCRDYFLIAFLTTTYSLATVIGFGSILAVIGLAQHESSIKWGRVYYVAAFGLVGIFGLEFGDLIISLFG